MSAATAQAPVVVARTAEGQTTFAWYADEQSTDRDALCEASPDGVVVRVDDLDRDTRAELRRVYKRLLAIRRGESVDADVVAEATHVAGDGGRLVPRDDYKAES